MKRMKKFLTILLSCILCLTATFTSLAACEWDDYNGGIYAQWDAVNTKVKLQLYKGSSYKVGSAVTVSADKTEYNFTEKIKNMGAGSYRYVMTDASTGAVLGESEYYQAGEDIIEEVEKLTWKCVSGNWYLKNYKNETLKGWQFVDGKWYYLDARYGNCYLNTTTPDGYYVDATGAWDGKPAA